MVQATRSPVAAALGRTRVGASSIASFALTAAAPFMVIGGYLTTAWAVTGIVPIGLALLAIGALLGIWAIGYTAMAARVVNAGSLYAFIANGLGAKAGAAAASVQLVAYSCLQVGLYGIAGATAASLAADLLGVQAPWWAWAMAAWAIIGVLGTRGIGISSRVLAAAVLAELVLIAVIVAVDLTNPATGGLDLAVFDPSGLTTAGLAALIAIATTAFIGVESCPVYSEEAREPATSVRRATFAGLTLMIIVYTAGAWAMASAVGADHLLDAAAQLGPDLLLVPASTHLGGAALVDAGHILLLTSAVAGLLSYHNAVARCGYALARDRVLPGWLATTNRTGAPLGASLAQTGTGLVVILAVGASGADPMTRLFFWTGAAGAMGILALMTTTSVAVITTFARIPGRQSRSVTQVMPAIAAVGLLICLVLVVTNDHVLLGVPQGHPACWIIPIGYLIMAGAGLGYATVLGRREPAGLHLGTSVAHNAPAAEAVMRR